VNPQKLRIPALVHHKSSGRGVVLLRDKSGTRRMVYLGKHGSTECERRYRKVLADYLAYRPITTRPKLTRHHSEWPTIAQLNAEFLTHAERYYVGPDGKQSGEVRNFRLALRPLLQLHRDTPTDEFSVTELNTVRELLLDTEYRTHTRVPHPQGCDRG
jgi:hypothetical protein